MITVEAIRADYPHPKRKSNNNADGEYCVGGALCMFMAKHKIIHENYHKPFPGALWLADILCVANERLKPEIASTMASFIIINNDGNNFDAAWHQMQLALEYK